MVLPGLGLTDISFSLPPRSQAKQKTAGKRQGAPMTLTGWGAQSHACLPRQPHRAPGGHRCSSLLPQAPSPLRAALSTELELLHPVSSHPLYQTLPPQGRQRPQWDGEGSHTVNDQGTGGSGPPTWQKCCCSAYKLRSQLLFCLGFPERGKRPLFLRWPQRLHRSPGGKDTGVGEWDVVPRECRGGGGTQGGKGEHS